ncbi:hypothetical protein HK104_001142 [Borealophlyctis nickersoniae]|nr:hypothetical protein HK104_001142 [Borealophlyctis nickersoniae]
MSPSSTGASGDNNPYQFITLSQSPRQRNTRNYILKLRQQPKHSRMCGFGEKVDRRPVDPPPIIQLEIQDTTSADENSYLYNPYYFMYASLISPDSEEELHLLRDGKTRSTTGSIVSSLYRLKDLDNKDGAFFVFPDLSVRMEGTYRLKFSLFEIINTEIYYCTSICSEIFNVYPAKKFPGMEESTFLSRTFAEQGLKIRIRKELRMRKHRNKRSASEIESSPDPKRRGRKKAPRRTSVDGSDNGSGSEDSDDAGEQPSKRRKDNNERSGGGGSSKDGPDKVGGHVSSFNPYERYEGMRPGGMHPDPRHYGHMGHDGGGHMYPPYGMTPKVWSGHGDPYGGGPPHYGGIPHYDNAGPAYPTSGMAGPEDYPPQVPHDARAYPHFHYPPRDHHGRPMMDWHHREYRHPGYPPAPYMPHAGYEDMQARPPAPPTGSGDHPMPNYYPHHPAAKHAEYGKPEGAHAKYPPPSGYEFGGASNYPPHQTPHQAAHQSSGHQMPPHQSGEGGPAPAVRPQAQSMSQPDYPAHAPHPGAHMGHAPYYPGGPYPTGGAPYGYPPQAAVNVGGPMMNPSGGASGPTIPARGDGRGAPPTGAGGAGAAGGPQQTSGSKPPGAEESEYPYNGPPQQPPQAQPTQQQQQQHQYGGYPGGPYKLPPIHEITDKNRGGVPQQQQQQGGASQLTQGPQSGSQQQPEGPGLPGVQSQNPQQHQQQGVSQPPQQPTIAANRGSEGTWM